MIGCKNQWQWSILVEGQNKMKEKNLTSVTVWLDAEYLDMLTTLQEKHDRANRSHTLRLLIRDAYEGLERPQVSAENQL